MNLEAILKLAFLLSGISNGANLTVGTGFAENDKLFLNPVGIMRVTVPVHEEKNWWMHIKASHISSIPDETDNRDGTGLNIVSIEFTAKIGGYHN